MRWDHSRFHFEWLGLFKQIQRKPPYIWFRGVCIPGNEFVRQKWGNSLPPWVIEDILAGYECHFIPGLTGIVITHSTWNAYEVTRKTHGMRGAALDLAITVNEENLRFHLGEVEVKLLWFMCLFTDFLGYVFFCSQIWAFCTFGFFSSQKVFFEPVLVPPCSRQKRNRTINDPMNRSDEGVGKRAVPSTSWDAVVHAGCDVTRMLPINISLLILTSQIRNTEKDTYCDFHH